MRADGTGDENYQTLAVLLLNLLQSKKEILIILPFLWVSFKNQPTYAVWESVGIRHLPKKLAA